MNLVESAGRVLPLLALAGLAAPAARADEVADWNAKAGEIVSVGTVLKADIGAGPTPTLTTTSPTANNAARSWSTVDAFVAEVSEARICDGVHYRNSTEVGKAMGVQVGTLAARKFLHSRE